MLMLMLLIIFLSLSFLHIVLLFFPAGQFDMDGDGEITTEELRSAMIKLMGEHMSRREIDTIVKEADDNGDGTVDFEGMKCPSVVWIWTRGALMRKWPECNQILFICRVCENDVTSMTAKQEKSICTMTDLHWMQWLYCCYIFVVHIVWHVVILI